MKTERDKMIAGEPYRPADAELTTARHRARDLCRAFNATTDHEADRRRALLTDLFAAGGDTAEIEPPFYCDYGSNIELGAHVLFNFNCVVLDVCRVRIGAHTLIAPSVQIFTAAHPMDALERRKHEFGKPVDIGEDVWIGGGSIILPGVTIGSRTVIGAGSVVNRNIPEGVLAVGNPCRVVREIDARKA